MTKEQREEEDWMQLHADELSEEWHKKWLEARAAEGFSPPVFDSIWGWSVTPNDIDQRGWRPRSPSEQYGWFYFSEFRKKKYEEFKEKKNG